MHIFFVNGIGVVFHTECKICICKSIDVNVIIILLKNFNHWQKCGTATAFCIYTTLQWIDWSWHYWAHIINVESWPRCCGGWKNCKEYHICPWGREVPLLALCTPWLLATHVCAYHGYLLLTLMHTYRRQRPLGTRERWRHLPTSQSAHNVEGVWNETF